MTITQESGYRIRYERYFFVDGKLMAVHTNRYKATSVTPAKAMRSYSPSWSIIDEHLMAIYADLTKAPFVHIAMIVSNIFSPYLCDSGEHVAGLGHHIEEKAGGRVSYPRQIPHRPSGVVVTGVGRQGIPRDGIGRAFFWRYAQ
jgi:hypothetical protein